MAATFYGPCSQEPATSPVLSQINPVYLTWLDKTERTGMTWRMSAHGLNLLLGMTAVEWQGSSTRQVAKEGDKMKRSTNMNS
jgi:hypothetical protein